MTQHYIGTKQVVAWEQERDGQPGYAIRYPDGYVSWSPKETFEKAYLPMGRDSDGEENGDTITEAMVDDFIVGYDSCKIGAKTTVVMANLRNGYTIVESSACVDPANYDHELGIGICKNRIRPHVWKLLGFLLQTARFGVQHNHLQAGA